MSNQERIGRAVRAMVEGARYQFQPKGLGTWSVGNPASGHFYETSETSCTCRDWEFRCQAAGARCKHQIALAQHRSTLATTVATFDRIFK